MYTYLYCIGRKPILSPSLHFFHLSLLSCMYVSLSLSLSLSLSNSTTTTSIYFTTTAATTAHAQKASPPTLIMASSQSQGFHPFHNLHFTDINYNLQPHSLGLLLIVIVFIFAAILLITSLYFYYHFVCRYAHLSIPTNFSSAPPQVPAQPQPQPQPQPLGLDSATIDNLPIFLHRSLDASSVADSGGETECSICLGLFEDEESIKVLPKCQHAYHTQCVDKWLSTRSSCPLCRATLQALQSPGEFTVIQL